MGKRRKKLRKGRGVTQRKLFPTQKCQRSKKERVEIGVEGERKGEQEEGRVDLAEMETRSKKRTEVSLEKSKKRERRGGEEQEGGERGESSSGGA